jgi:hypothetical protein
MLLLILSQLTTPTFLSLATVLAFASIVLLAGTPPQPPAAASA